MPRNTWVSFSGTVTDPNQVIPCDQQAWSISGIGTEVGCTRNRTISETGLYTVTLSAEDDAGEVATDQIRVLVKDWTEYDPTYFTIYEPRANDLLVWSDRVWLRYTSEPGGSDATVTWELETDFGITTFVDNTPLSFILYEEVVLPGGRSEGTLRATFERDGVTVTDEIPVRFEGPPL